MYWNFPYMGLNLFYDLLLSDYPLLELKCLEIHYTFQTFYCELILDLQNSFKNGIESSNIDFIQLLLMSYDNNVIIRKLTNDL